MSEKTWLYRGIEIPTEQIHDWIVDIYPDKLDGESDHFWVLVGVYLSVGPAEFRRMERTMRISGPEVGRVKAAMAKVILRLKARQGEYDEFTGEVSGADATA